MAMILVSILLFGKLRQPLIIWITVPLAVIGTIAGLLGLDASFDFMSLLGALFLVGLLIKNAIVLIEEIDQEIAAGKAPYEAILDSGVSRMRPVVLAAGTTILGLILLLTECLLRQHGDHHDGRPGLRDPTHPDYGSDPVRHFVQGG